MTVYCKKCGCKIEENSKFCGNCGAEVVYDILTNGAVQDETDEAILKDTYNKDLVAKQIRSVKWYVLQVLGLFQNYALVLGVVVVIVLLLASFKEINLETFGFVLGSSGKFFVLIAGIVCHIIAVLISREMYRDGQLYETEVLNYFWHSEKDKKKNKNKVITTEPFDNRSTVLKVVSGILIGFDIVTGAIVVIKIAGAFLALITLSEDFDFTIIFIAIDSIRVFYVYNIVSSMFSRILVAKGIMSEHHVRKFWWED